MDDDDTPALVLDNGCGTFKAGFSGDDAPRVVIPTLVGRPRLQGPGADERRRCVGDEARAKRDTLTLSYPMSHGMVVNWDEMESVWHHVFDAELRVAPEAQPVLLTEPFLNPKINRERVAQVMFERFGVPALYVAPSPILALYASGRGSALVLDCGEGVMDTVVVFEGHRPPEAISRVDFGGRDLTRHLARLLGESRGLSLATAAEHDIARDIKEKLCFVASDFAAEMAKPAAHTDKSYALPDGNVVTVGTERFRCPEALFDPSLVGLRSDGIHTTVYNAVMRCDVDIRRHMFANVVLSGGTTLLPGFSERLAKEVAALAPPSARVRTVAPPERLYSVWIGGSILSSLSSFQDAWVTRAQYDEEGPTVVHRKCL